MMPAVPGSELLELVRALAHLSAVDWMYADHYVDRARELLAPICSHEQYTLAVQQLGSLPGVTQDLQSAIQREDWQMVSELAERGARLREQTGRIEPFIDVAKLVYGEPSLAGLRAALILNGVLEHDDERQNGRATASAHLRRLAESDGELAGFYRSRAAYFESAPTGTASSPARHPTHDLLDLRREIDRATAQGDFQRIRELVAALRTDTPTAGAGRVLQWPSAVATESLRAPIPAVSIVAAQRMGLVPVQLPEVERYGRYLATATDSGVEPVLRENLDLLRHHLHVTSAASRYLPWFGTETLLVEDFDEAQPDAGSSLLDLLEIPRRRGVSRADLERQLRSGGMRACRFLGLDPRDYCVTCIPFDAYLRLAPQFGWGERPLWTHFDGYRLTAEGELLALVGGNSDYGGRFDLCEVERSYDAPRLIVRLAVLRRLRLAPTSA